MDFSGFLPWISETGINWLPFFLTALFSIGFTVTAKRFLFRKAATAADGRLTSQLLIFSLGACGFIACILALPMSEATRNQLLSLFGILFTAAVALSSTTFLGNIMAGLMLRVIGDIRMGDFIRVQEHFGRISERGLLHTEIQNEDRDLTTLPNLFLVTHPVKVVRSSGTIISTEISLGYDVSHHKVMELLEAAAIAAKLTDPFVHVMGLGDFSITYRVSGFLEDVKLLLSRRSKLRGCVIDALHGAGIEIVSPTFMNQRQYQSDERFLTSGPRIKRHQDGIAEQVAFDKAEEAGNIEEVTYMINKIAEEITKLEERLSSESGEEVRGRLELRMTAFTHEKERLEKSLKFLESRKD